MQTFTKVGLDTPLGRNTVARVGQTPGELA